MKKWALSICGVCDAERGWGEWKSVVEDLGVREIGRDRDGGREREWGIRGWLCFGLLLITIIILCPVFHSAVRAHLSPRLCVRHCDCLVFKKPSVSLCSDKCFSNTNHSWVHLIWICERGFDSISRMLLQARHTPFNTVATCVKASEYSHLVYAYSVKGLGEGCLASSNRVVH